MSRLFPCCKVAVAVSSALIGSSLMVASGPSTMSARAASSDVDLRSETAITIVGDRVSADRVNAAGDINADGIPDLIVSKGDLTTDPKRGLSWVVFGRADPGVINLDELGDRGFIIEGANDGDYASQIAPAGDVNGDGHDDVLVGAPGADNGGRTNSGSVYVVFGKATTEPVELNLFNANAQGLAGFRIDGGFFGDLAGEDVAGVGDINGDGLADIGLAAPFSTGFYVVFGKADPAPIDLVALDRSGSNPLGFRINSREVHSSDATSIAGAGDVNNDGVPDVVVGVIPRNGARGDAYVVFGQTEPSGTDLGQLGDRGFRIRGFFGGSYTGYSTAGAGDINGDGKDDVLIGAIGLCCTNGDAFVVFGKKSSKTVNLRRLGRRGFWIRSGRQDDALGASLGGAGDLNADGLADFFVGSSGTTARKRPYAGVVYVIYGKRSHRRIELERLGKQGYRIVGARRASNVGSRAAAIGDLNGDGVTDFATAADPRSDASAGRIHVVWGR